MVKIQCPNKLCNFAASKRVLEKHINEVHIKENPWLVENIQEFSFLNCPECAFKAKEENVFQDHAVKNHSMSHIYFGQSLEVGLTSFLSGEFSNATVVNQPDEKKDNSTTVQSIESEFVTIKTEFHSEVSIEDKIIDPLEKIPSQEFIISDIKTEELKDITADVDLDINEQSLNPNENVSKNFNNQSTNINNWNVFTTESQEIIPIGKFPKKDKTTSIFKCQIPPKKSIMKTKNYQEIVEKNLASTSHLENAIMPFRALSPTYTCLITEALNNAPSSALLLEDIYKALSPRRPDYKMGDNVWKVDVKNNLSFNKKFIQEGEYWKLAPDSSISISKVKKMGLEIFLDPEKMACLIAEAINNAPTDALLLADIYKAINARHPIYKLTQFFQDEVRKNLFSNKNFIQEGNYWKLAPDASISIQKVQIKARHPSNKQDHYSIAESNEIEGKSIASTSNHQENVVKPFQTYALLITEALNNAPNGALVGADSICKAINTNHPEYKMDNDVWKADVKNNLFINKKFIQEGEYWKLAPDTSISIPKVQIKEKHLSNKQDLDSIADSNEIEGKSLVSTSCQENVVKPEKVNDYVRMIAEALNNAPTGALILADIHRSINARHPQSRVYNDFCKTVVKNNLLMNGNFIQEGEYWKLAPGNLISKFLINSDETVSEKENVDKSEKCGTKRPYTMSELSPEIPAKTIREEEVPIISKLWKKCPNKFCNFGAEEEHVIEKHMRIVHINQCPHCEFSCKKGAGLKGFSAMADHIEKEHKDIEKLVRKSITLSIPSISSEVLLDMNSQVKSFQKEATQNLSDQGSFDDLR